MVASRFGGEQRRWRWEEAKRRNQISEGNREISLAEEGRGNRRRLEVWTPICSCS